MHELYLKLKPFYEKFLERIEPYGLITSERHEICLSFFIKFIGIYLVLQSDIIPTSFKKSRNLRKFIHEILFQQKKETDLNSFVFDENIGAIFHATHLETQIKDALTPKEWDNLVNILNEYKCVISERFSDENQFLNEITPEFLSYLTESLLIDYERFFSLKSRPKLSKRKDKGVFFTPWTLIKKIVKKTLTKFESGQIPNLKILDPSCGTGSFLIFCANELFNNYGSGEVSKITSNIVQNNIYGVDLSLSNILVTKIRLLFWILDKGKITSEINFKRIFNNILIGNSLFGIYDETFQYPLNYDSIIDKILFRLTNETSRGRYSWISVSSMFKNRRDEDLSIKDVEKINKLFNSLIKRIYFNYVQNLQADIKPRTTINEEELESIALFHWGLVYPDVVKRGGFDIILGNPPYGRSVLSTLEKQLVKLLYKSSYGQSKKYSLNIASAFIERSINLLSPHGVLGLIVPYSILRVEEFELLRKYILTNTQVWAIHDEANAFADVTLEMCLLFLTKNPITSYNVEIKPRFNITANSEVNISVFKKYDRFMIYHNDFWDLINNVGKQNIISGDYGIDHRIVKKDLNPEYSEKYHIPFLHSGRSVRNYGLNPSYFQFSKPHPRNFRFTKYYRESRIITTAIGNKFHVAYKPDKFIPGTNVSILEIPPEYHYFPMIILLNSDLINYMLKRYILNFSHLTVYLHKYYTKLIPIKYPFEFESEWKILCSYLLFLTQCQLSLGFRFKKRIKYLHTISNYLVYELYFPGLISSEKKLIVTLSQYLNPIEITGFFDLIFERDLKGTTNERVLRNIVQKNRLIISKSLKFISKDPNLKYIRRLFADQILIQRIKSEL